MATSPSIEACGYSEGREHVAQRKLAVSCILRCICLSFISLRRVDDIEDDSQLRRGTPGTWRTFSSIHDLTNVACIVAHRIYGVPQTINSANYVYFLAYQELFNLRDTNLSTPTNLDKIVTGVLSSTYMCQRLI